MSTMELEYPKQSFSKFKVFAILILLVICFYAVTYNGHATARHGVKAEKTRECLENKNILFVMTHFLTGKCAVVGEISKPDEKGIGEYGIQIRSQEGREITSFIKKDFLKIVIRYLENAGYFLPE
jgi:hypothetical protein